MNAAVPDSLITGYGSLIDALKLPDPDDRHILAAAIVGKASVIVTFNEKDFPSDTVSEYSIHVQNPDEFVLSVAGVDASAVIASAKLDFKHYSQPPLTVDDYLNGIQTAGLPTTAAFLRNFLVLLTEEESSA